MRIVPESEAVERAALIDVHDAATPGIRAALGLELTQSGSILLSIAGRLPESAIVINRCLGLGLGEAATRASVMAIVDAYRDARVSRFFLHRHPDSRPPGLVKWLEDAGLIRARGWQKFSRDLRPPPTVATDLRIEQVGADHGPAFADIVCDAFDLGSAAKPWLARLPARRNWHVFMSFEAGHAAGCGALFIDNGVAWSDFGATAPAFRRRGSQGAVLARRIAHARSLGCKRIHTCTGEAVSGDPQHSYGNILKMGFEPELVRENWSPPQT